MVEQVSSSLHAEINDLLFIGFSRGNPLLAGQNKEETGFQIRVALGIC